MDPEREVRKQLISFLGNSFLCFEEVALRPPFQIRADVVALPLDDAYFDMPLAFEVKRPQPGRECHYAEWAPAIKQAADYVYAAIEPDDRLKDFVGRRVVAAFVFPAPPFVIDPCDNKDRDEHLKMLTTGAFHAALYFRVGPARTVVHATREKRLILSLGPNAVWDSAKGWEGAARNLLTQKRKLGSRMIDMLAEFDETGGRPDGMPWE